MLITPRVPFVPPLGVPPPVAAKMSQASSIFRMFDRDQNGYLDKEEWKRQAELTNNEIEPCTSWDWLGTRKRQRDYFISQIKMYLTRLLKEVNFICCNLSQEFIEFWLRNI